MLAALTRGVSPALEACELTWIPRQQIDMALAVRQHLDYERALAELGLRVISLASEPEMPDSMFVEDPLLVLDEVAIITRMACESRRAESETLAAAIAPYRPLRRITAPATLEGGDVMRIGRELFAGLSSRTNEAGIAGLRAIASPLGYRVHPVTVRGCLHLKSACCWLGEGEAAGKILAKPEWLDIEALEGFEIIPVPADEPGAANVLPVGDTLLMPACFPRTEAMLRRQGYKIRTVDISELIKAEAAVTCSSVLFRTRV